MSAGSPVLAADGAARRFGAQPALEPCSFELWDGEVVALVGPNGAGKSTLLALLAGALDPSEGRIERRPGVRVGWAPQRPAHYARLTARENLELFARLEGASDPQRAAELSLATFDLPREARASGNLSVGNRQRLNLAIALLGNPTVLLLDEPTASLDPEQRRRLWETVAQLKDAGGSVVFATQNVEEVERVADRVGVLVDGALVFDGSLDEYERTQAADVFA